MENTRPLQLHANFVCVGFNSESFLEFKVPNAFCKVFFSSNRLVNSVVGPHVRVSL